MENVRNLFLKSLEKLEKYLGEDFKLLSADIKKISASGMSQAKSVEGSNLIQLLQYHDVIGQKVQHIKKINAVLDEEIRILHLEEGLNTIIPDLLLLMMKLTRFAKDEYTKVVVKIRLNLNKLEVKGGWSEQNPKPFYEEILFLLHIMDLLYKQVKEQYQKSTDTEIKDFQPKLQEVYQFFSMDSEREIYKAIMSNKFPFSEELSQDHSSHKPGDIDLF